jgi:hypothetical protein
MIQLGKCANFACNHICVIDAFSLTLCPKCHSVLMGFVPYLKPTDEGVLFIWDEVEV